jgi:predicted O-methyltransferase YrrM
LTTLEVALSIALGVCVALLILTTSKVARYRAKWRQTGMLRPWPIRKVEVRELDPVFEPGPLGPSRDTATELIGEEGVRGGISDRESWILCTLAKKSRRIFELGTCTGKTTYLLARNAPEDARVTTLTLHPDQAGAVYKREAGDTRADTKAALSESKYTSFFYSGTEVEPKIQQVFGDSKMFDESEYRESFDMVFVDGSHAESYVLSDSRKAIAMCRPGGVVFWHDYRGPYRIKGVYRALNSLSRELPLRHIEGTSLVFYRKPAD